MNDLDPSAIVTSQIVADPITQKEIHRGAGKGFIDNLVLDSSALPPKIWAGVSCMVE